LGQSRQLWGKTMPSERPGHRLMETWHPLGVVGVISAFNFPVAVYSWNTALALVAVDAVLWKPSGHAVLAALAAQSLLSRGRRGGVDALGERRARRPRSAIAAVAGRRRGGGAGGPRTRPRRRSGHRRRHGPR